MKTPTIDKLWKRYRESRNTRLRGQLFNHNIHVAECAAAYVYDGLNNPRCNRDELIVAARLMLIPAIERFVIHPERAEFRAYAAAFIAKRLLSAVASGQHPLDAAIALHEESIFTPDDSASTEKQWRDWNQFDVKAFGGLNRLQWAVLGLHVIEGWHCDELARRFRMDESMIRRTVGNAAAKLIYNISHEGAANA